MSEQTSGLGKRKLWIGGGIAAVAALLAVSYVSNFPPGAQNAVGTIVPAQAVYCSPGARHQCWQSGWRVESVRVAT